MTIEKNRYFAIMADEHTDKSNKEQLSFCVRTVADSLKPERKSFLDFISERTLKETLLFELSKTKW